MDGRLESHKVLKYTSFPFYYYYGPQATLGYREKKNAPRYMYVRFIKYLIKSCVLPYILVIVYDDYQIITEVAEEE